MSTVWDPPRPAAPSPAPPSMSLSAAADTAAGETGPFADFCAEVARALARPAERKRNVVRLAEALGALGDASVAIFVEQPGGGLVCEIGTGELAQMEGDCLPAEGVLESDAFATGEARESANLRADDRAYLPQQRGLPNAPAVALPMEVAGERMGVVLFAARRRGEAFSPARVEALRQGVMLVAGALRNFVAHERSRAARTVLDAIRAARPREAESVRKLVRAVRHELNTPVSVILGNLQLCAAADPAEWRMSPAEFRRAVADAGAALEALSRILHTMDEGKREVEIDPEGRFLPPQ
ncbi:MAG TPA: histidine kinase dimerization/phospho-acceptor domain-containing protein [Longimicrobium sp.]|nr:histidine kinase dimerization/phospho-acceptor domain-containing protein [Longimicrobium sp.]